MVFRSRFVTAADFKRIALSFEGAEEGLHMGAVDFRSADGSSPPSPR